jgi:hypothetical protein
MSGKLKILIIVFYYDSTIFNIYCCDSKNNILIFSHIGNLKLLLMPSILHSTLLLLFTIPKQWNFIKYLDSF